MLFVLFGARHQVAITIMELWAPVADSLAQFGAVHWRYFEEFGKGSNGC